MKPRQPFLNGVDIGLIVGIVVFSLLGGFYAVFSGVISVPGVKPFLQADTPPSPAAKKTAATASPFDPLAITTQPSVAATGAASASPAAAETETPQSEMKNRDATRKSDLATIQVALKQYNDKYKKYPLTNSGEGKYEKVEAALKILIDTGTVASLPADPSPPDRGYGYYSDGKTYSLSAWLEDTSDPAGANNTDTPPKYLYTVKNP